MNAMWSRVTRRLRRLRSRPTLVCLVSHAEAVLADGTLRAALETLFLSHRIVLAEPGRQAPPPDLRGIADELIGVAPVAPHAPTVASACEDLKQTYRPRLVFSADIMFVEHLLQFEYRDVPAIILLREVPQAAPQPDDAFDSMISRVSGLVVADVEILRQLETDYPHVVGRLVYLFGPEDLPADAGRGRLVRHDDLAASIASAARTAAALNAQITVDHATIAASGLFEPAFNLGARGRYSDDQDVLRDYLVDSKMAYPRHLPRAGYTVRKPCPGFHPLIYASRNEAYRREDFADPFAHYLRNGRPEGTWRRTPIGPFGQACPVAAEQARIGIHLHLHYPEYLDDFLVRLAMNAARADLFVTTTSEESKALVERGIACAGTQAKRIALVPNRGRDIGPFVALLNEGVLDGYDLIGHFHGKRSPQMQAQYGDAWRVFLLEHLVGGRHKMMDRILAAFAEDPVLGLVFPEDPALPDWDDNRSIADEIARRAGLELPLPDHFDFPAGTMFWCRRAALQPLADLRLTDADFPPEPVPVDGSVLHAYERLIPFFARHAGFTFATTRVDGVEH